MIITKTPFRISLCGGGSDMPDFYRLHGGSVVSTSINRYMYISIHPYFDEKKTVLKYSQTEIVENLNEIQHKIFRCVLNELEISGVEITSTADVPSGTGLGSSSSFTVGLLHLLYCYKGRYIAKNKIAEQACDVEINRLGSPIGKQDQYAVACGGLNYILFHSDDTVSVEPIIIKSDAKILLQDNLAIYYTGLTHNANSILAEQKKNIYQQENTSKLIRISELAGEMKRALEQNELEDIGAMLNEGWQKKKELASGIVVPRIDELYETAMKNGASGGKLLGAGGGGFLLFYCEKERQKQLDKALGLKRFRAKFESDGTSVVYIGDHYSD